MAQKKENILLILSHPNTDKSFNHKLTQEAEKLLKERGHKVKVVDLYKIKFNPLAGANDFKQVHDKDKFDYQAEQKYANIDAKGENFVDEIREQMKNVEWATTIIYQFPLEWLDIPAILKGYVERVYSYYFAYGGDFSLKGKKWMVSVTTGGPESMYKETTVETFLNSFCVSHLFSLKAEKLPLFVNYCVGPASQKEREQMIENYKTHLKKYF